METTQKKLLAAIFLVSSIFFLDRTGFCDAVLPPPAESAAYQEYLKRPRVELSRLIYLMDRFKGAEFKVVYDDYVYDSDYALKISKQYISNHYKNENAEKWIKLNAYRSKPANKIIYLKHPDGKTRPLRDALIEELKALQQVEKK